MSPDSKPQKKRETFTLQIQGKGLRAKVVIPGWAIAPILRFAKEAERA